MQQTETYQLNLIETSDNFSPNPLNQNTQKLEQALSAETAQRAAETAALDSRVTVLEGHKIAVGSYTGNGVVSGQTINLGFFPRAVFAQQGDTGVVIATRANPLYGDVLVLTENGFRAATNLNNKRSMNLSNTTYVYCAIL